MIYVDNVAFPNPSKYDVQISDLDSSDTTRNELGVLVRNRVRQGVIKLQLGFTVRGTEVEKMMKAVEPASVSVRVHEFGGIKDRTFQAYVGDRSASMKVCLPNMATRDILWEVSFSLVEY